MLLLVLSGLGAAEKVKLPERARKWLDEEVVTIITAREKDVFLKLQTDRERDAFIQAFWKQRDPTPGTPENEFRAEHYKRLAYADSIYGRGAQRRGRFTDRGRIYIILGPPRTVETVDTINGVYPVEIWFYQPETESKLPPAFNVIFYKPHGMGDYVLYSPAQDGPKSLIADSMESYSDDRAAYQSLKKLAPNLAPQTLSLIPGEHLPAGAVSLASNFLLKNIYEAPQQKVDDAYAEALLKYKDSVEVEYTANYIGCEAQAQVLRSESGPFVVHFAVEPQKLSLDNYGDRFSANFDLNGRLTDAAGRTVYQFDKQFGLSLSASELESVRGTTLALQDMFPCLPGQYKFDLLIKNTVSKEFATYEVGLTVPSLPAAKPVLGAPLLAYGFETAQAAAGEEVPFRVAGKQALSQAQKNFTPRDTLFVVFQVYGLDAAWQAQGRVRLTYEKDGKTTLTQTRKISDIRTGETLVEVQPLTGFAAGYYDLGISLLDAGGEAVETQKAHFDVSPASALPRPRIMAKVIRPENLSEWDYALGLQAMNQGGLELAKAHLGKAYSRKPGDVTFALGYAQDLFLLKDYPKVREVLQPLLSQEGCPPEAYSWLGRTSHAMGLYEQAISYYKEYLARAGTNLEVMNLVGSCYYQLGDMAQALATWRKSLAINPNQEQIKKLVDSLTKK
jgi:GWxTD domain-containing protein